MYSFGWVWLYKTIIGTVLIFYATKKYRPIFLKPNKFQKSIRNQIQSFCNFRPFSTIITTINVQQKIKKEKKTPKYFYVVYWMWIEFRRKVRLVHISFIRELNVSYLKEDEKTDMKNVNWIGKIFTGFTWFQGKFLNRKHFPLKWFYYIIGLIICNWVVILSILVTIWCTYDAAGRSWVKMKKYQRSMRESESRFNYKRSGSMNRNWRQR